MSAWWGHEDRSRGRVTRLCDVTRSRGGVTRQGHEPGLQSGVTRWLRGGVTTRSRGGHVVVSQGTVTRRHLVVELNLFGGVVEIYRCDSDDDL